MLEILKISSSTAYRWEKIGILKPIRPGGNNTRVKLYKLSDIQKLVD